MAFAALMTWFGTVLLGLYMLTVWLIENDATGPGASHLPAPVVFTHLTLAVSGLGVWAVYLIADQETLAWIAVGTLSVIVLLGLSMFARWIPVHHGPAEPASQVPFLGAPLPFPEAPLPLPGAPLPSPGAPLPLPGAPLPSPGAPLPLPGDPPVTPPESNFPIAVVACHGLLATATYVLVLLTALNVGGS